ncbi:MAG: hypothetical protein QOJ65_826 [Fimbriimonadaceae bacterium]|nr:hypothetical protein [Fimbriimonadaceae bacterium]
MVQLVALLLLQPSVAETRRISATELPFERVHGVARSRSRWLVGGLRGLYLGAPGGDWREVSNQAVKTIVSTGNTAWVLYGNGAVDKVELDGDRLYYDVLKDAAKRPWAASIAADRASLLFGGDGGWIEKSGSAFVEKYPVELLAKQVTAAARVGKELWLGTQDGLFHIVGGKPARLGFGAGMPDVWVTALMPSGNSILAGLATGGLVRVERDKVELIPTPSTRVRLLARFGGRLVLGALDGAWILEGKSWTPLCDVEPTFIGELGNELVIGTPNGLRLFKSS